MAMAIHQTYKPERAMFDSTSDTRDQLKHSESLRSRQILKTQPRVNLRSPRSSTASEPIIDAGQSLNCAPPPKYGLTFDWNHPTQDPKGIIHFHFWSRLGWRTRQ